MLQDFAEEAQDLFEQSPMVKLMTSLFLIIVTCLFLCCFIVTCQYYSLQGRHTELQQEVNEGN